MKPFRLYAKVIARETQVKKVGGGEKKRKNWKPQTGVREKTDENAKKYDLL